MDEDINHIFSHAILMGLSITLRHSNTNVASVINAPRTLALRAVASGIFALITSTRLTRVRVKIKVGVKKIGRIRTRFTCIFSMWLIDFSLL
jgi:hypothetical protein